jgi:hypothetical protein
MFYYTCSFPNVMFSFFFGFLSKPFSVFLHVLNPFSVSFNYDLSFQIFILLNTFKYSLILYITTFYFFHISSVFSLFLYFSSFQSNYHTLSPLFSLLNPFSVLFQSFFSVFFSVLISVSFSVPFQSFIYVSFILFYLFKSFSSLFHNFSVLSKSYSAISIISVFRLFNLSLKFYP